MIKTMNLTKKYGSKDATTYALRDLSVELPDNKFIAITGKSGSGKTTLLNMIGLIDTPSKGTVLVDDKDIFMFKSKEILEYRRNMVGIVFQSFELIPVLTVYENIMVANTHSKRCEEEYFDEIVKTLGLEDLLHRYPDQLSGGQKQRVAIARAIINRPRILLADEPTGNLDSDTGKEVIRLLKCIATDYNMTVIVVTHDTEIANNADMNICLKDGKVSSL